jgi:hypothetical protein
MWRVLAATCVFVVLAMRPLRRSEEAWGWLEKAQVVLIALGLIGAGAAGAVAPNPAPDAPRWFLIIAYPSIAAALLFLIAGTQLQLRLDNYRPKLTVRPIERHGQPEYACLQVTNLGEDRVRGCTGYLFSVEIETDTHGPQLDTEKHSTYLQWSSKDDGGKEITFHRQAVLDVAELSGPVFPLVVFRSDQRDEYRLVGGFSYLLDIEIASENAGSIRDKYRLKSNQAGSGVEIFEAVSWTVSEASSPASNV